MNAAPSALDGLAAAKRRAVFFVFFVLFVVQIAAFLPFAGAKGPSRQCPDE
jgi:hypothetical protein